MNNNLYIDYNSKNNSWFDKMYNEKIEKLHAKSLHGTILNYIDYNKFINTFKNKMQINYFLLNINDISFLNFYGKSFKQSIFFKIIDDIETNFDNKNYTYKNSFLYEELKQNKITTLSDFYKLKEPNNLQKYSKFYEFYPWIKDIKIKPEKYCGLYSDSIIDMHFIKFKRVLEGIKKYGIKYNDKNMISGYFLKKNNTSKLIVTSGLHRAMVIKYLLEKKKINTEQIICQGNKVVDLKNIDSWYHVKNNFISKNNAETIFNQLYNI
jgi:hypothetical protein